MLLLLAPQAPKRKVAAAPAALKKQAAPAKPTNPLYEKRPKTFGAPMDSYRGREGGGQLKRSGRPWPAAA